MSLSQNVHNEVDATWTQIQADTEYADKALGSAILGLVGCTTTPLSDGYLQN